MGAATSTAATTSSSYATPTTGSAARRYDSRSEIGFFTSDGIKERRGLDFLFFDSTPSSRTDALYTAAASTPPPPVVGPTPSTLAAASTPPPPAVGPAPSTLAAAYTPPPPVVGPTPSTLAAAYTPPPPAVGPTLSAPPAAMASGSAPPPPAAGWVASMPLPQALAMSPPPVGVHAEDAASHHEGKGTGSETLPAVWINEGNKIEPAHASQFITKSIQVHFPGAIHRFIEFPMDVQDSLFDMFMRTHRLAQRSYEPRVRLAWTNTARDNFKHLLYNARRTATKKSGSAEITQWKEHGPIWMRNDYWVALCDKWAEERWVEKSAKAKANRAKLPEANVHTSGSVSFATHKARLETQLKRPAKFDELFDETHKKKGTDQYVSQRAREVAETYNTRMEEKYSENNQRPELDPEVWVAASGVPKKGHVYGFGHSLGTTRVLSSYSSSVSHATSPFTTHAAPGGPSASTHVPSVTPDQCREIFNESMSQSLPNLISQIVSQTLTHMGVLTPRPPPPQQPQDDMRPGQGPRPAGVANPVRP